MAQKTEPFLTALQIAVQARFPVFVWGMPGSGKTVNVEVLSKALKEPLWTVILSVREPTDQGGLPKATASGVEMVPPRWAKELAATGHGIVFMDEFNTADSRIQASALRVVHEGYAGDLKLPADTSFIAAGNYPEHSSGAYDLMSAMANRFVHLDWAPSVLGWCDGMMAGFPSPTVKSLPKTWRSKIPLKQSLVSSYIRKHTAALEQEPLDRREAGRAWNSRRTWRMAAHLMAAAEATGFSDKSEVTALLIKGCIGETAFTSFSAYMANMDLIDPEEYLTEPHDTPFPNTQDKQLVTINSIVSATLDNSYDAKAREARQRIGWVLLARVATDFGADIAIPAARVLARNQHHNLFNDAPDELIVFTKIMEDSKVDFSLDTFQ